MENTDVIVLSGAFAPIASERSFDHLEVEGEVPADLNGVYVRNGPNRKFAAEGRYHWFDGDGMVHAIKLEDGRATYRNRWVESAGLQEERKAGHALYRGIISMSGTEAPTIKVTGNTNIVHHAGKLMALVESSFPITRKLPKGRFEGLSDKQA